MHSGAFNLVGGLVLDHAAHCQLCRAKLQLQGLVLAFFAENVLNAFKLVTFGIEQQLGVGENVCLVTPEFRIDLEVYVGFNNKKLAGFDDFELAFFRVLNLDEEFKFVVLDESINQF